MKFTIEIICDNAAFCDEDTGEPNPGPEIARLLRRVARYIDSPSPVPGDTATLFDVNGNRAGEWSMED